MNLIVQVSGSEGACQRCRPNRKLTIMLLMQRSVQTMNEELVQALDDLQAAGRKCRSVEDAKKAGRVYMLLQELPAINRSARNTARGPYDPFICV